VVHIQIDVQEAMLMLTPPREQQQGTPILA
jgi:hypothetical protein